MTCSFKTIWFRTLVSSCAFHVELTVVLKAKMEDRHVLPLPLFLTNTSNTSGITEYVLFQCVINILHSFFNICNWYPISIDHPIKDLRILMRNPNSDPQQKQDNSEVTMVWVCAGVSLSCRERREGPCLRVGWDFTGLWSVSWRGLYGASVKALMCIMGVKYLLCVWM